MKLKKVISLLLAIAMLPIGQIVFAAENEAAGGSKAGWFIEAESDSTAVTVSNEDAVGGKAVKSEFTVNFTIPEEKGYYLYARVLSQVLGGSIDYAFDTDTAATADVSSAGAVYTWVRLSGAKTLGAGEHSVTVYASDDVRVDGIIVSELSSLPVDAAVTSAAYADELALPDTYPDIFDENMVNEDIAFEKGDRVLFLGDSITHSVGHTFQYHTWILTYYATRYPDSEFTYINAGRSGDTTANALKRLVSDVNIHDYNKIVVMLGTNDVNRNTWNGHRDDSEACDAVVETYITNLDILLENFSDKEIILMGPTCWNEFSAQSASAAEIIEGYNSEMRRVNNYLKDYAYDNSIPYIDLNTSLTKAMLYYTGKDSSYAGLYGNGDRTHPGELGHYIMAYNFLKAQGEGSMVASTEIDATAATISAENATVSNLSANQTAVSYTYKPSALPMPADTYYRQLQQLIPIDEELNRETIKVTGLSEGNYTVKLNGVAALENIPYDDLEKGINIADLSVNPNQQKALAVKGVINKRSVIEKKNIRDFRQTEFSAITTKANGLTSTMTYDELISQAQTVSSLASYVTQKKALYNYFGAIDYSEKLIYTINKPEEVTVTIERTGDLDKTTTSIHTYTTEEVVLNEGSPEIVFEDKDTLSSAADFTVTDGVLTAYNKNAANVYIPTGVKEIKSGVFNSDAIEKLYVPASVNTIEAGAFKDIKNADVHFSLAGFLNDSATYEMKNASLYVEDSLLYYNPTKADTSYEISYGTDAIADYAFANALNLTEVTIPDTVKEIGESAFDNTKLTIKCYEGSAAYDYAVKNSIAYELVPYSDNTNLSSLSFNKVDVFDFDPEKKEYNIKLFAPLSDVNIEAEAQEASIGAAVEIKNNGAAAPCTITISVTAQDKKTVGEYVLNFTVEEAISNFSKYSAVSNTEIKQLRLDDKYSIYTSFDADANNQFILNTTNTSNEFGYGVILQRNKGDASNPTYNMPFYSNGGDPLCGASDGRYWYSFDISEAATVYVGICEGKTWENGEANGWTTDGSGLTLYGLSGAKLYKKHFAAGTVNIPSFGTYSSYEANQTSRIEWNPSCYAIVFDSSFASEEDKTADFAVTKALIGANELSETEDNAPELDRDEAYDSLIVVEGTAPAGESVSLIVTPADDDSVLIAVGQTTASDLGVFSFEALPGEDIAAGVTYKAEITSSKNEKYIYYFKTTDVKHSVTVAANSEVGKYFMNQCVGASDFKYADTKLGDRETYTGNMVIHTTETVDGVVTPVKENNAYVMETVTGHTVGVQFTSERTLHRAGIVGSALKGLNHILVNQNVSPGRMKNTLASATLTWEGESITLDEMYAKYCAFFGGNNVFYTFTPDADGTAYVALPYENEYFEEKGWGHMVMGFDDIPEGYAEWGVVPESTYFSVKYPYQLAKFQHDAPQTNIWRYNHVYYRSFEAGEEVEVYTGGANYTKASSELPKTAIRWGEHLSADTDFTLTYNGNTKNISSDTEVFVEEESVTLSAESAKGATVVLSKTNIDTFPATVTATVTAAAGNTATYEITIDYHTVSTKIKNISYTIAGISNTFTVPGFDGSEGNEFTVRLPHADAKSKLVKGVESVSAAIELIDSKGTYTMTPSDGVLDFSESGKADAEITVTDSEGNKESFVIHFSIPVYNIETKGNYATLRSLYGKNQISGYEGYSVGELSGYEDAGYAPAGPIDATVFPRDAYVIARNKGDASSTTKNMDFYGGATYNSDETGWWMTFTVTDDSYVYVYDSEGWGWPNKDESYWSVATNLDTTSTKYYVHFAKAGETVKIPNYGYSSSWEADPENPQRLTRDPSYYIVMPLESAKMAKINIVTLGGEVTIKADGKEYSNSGTVTMEFRQSTNIVLSADSTDFMYWLDGSTGRIVSYETEYEFIAGTDRRLTAIYRDTTDEGVYYVMFKNANDEVLTAGYTLSEINVPTNPYLAGYVFNGWYIDGKKADLKAGDDISDYGLDKDTVIKAGFEAATGRYSLYFENQSATEPYGTYGYNEQISLTAPEAEEGLTFAYWIKDGQIVSYNTVYSFRMGLSNAHVKAVYLASPTEAMPTLAMSEPVVLSGENRISFMAERDLPEGYVLLESGILLGTSAELTIDSAAHKVISASSLANGQFTVRKANVNAGDKWYAKAYMIYQQAGAVYTIYSNEVSATYTE